MFKLIFPIARYTLGYGPTNAIGMGENLPKMWHVIGHSFAANLVM